MEDNRGFLDLPQGKIWYRIAGKPGKTPLLVLHGGPGGRSDNLWNLDLLSDERQVIFYDQLGSGRSDRPNDPKFWTVEYFIEELKTIREKLKLDSIHLYGHSWGTMLSTDYLAMKPNGVKSVIFAGPCISVPRWAATCERHLAEMPNNLGELINECEKSGKQDSLEYKEAVKLYNKTYECRVDLPAKPAESIFGKEVYNYMWGPNEYNATGTLKGYDHSDLLSEIKLPALFICGKYDSASPEDTAYYQSKILGAEIKVFENSAHFPHREEETLFMQIVRDFLKRHD